MNFTNKEPQTADALNISRKLNLVLLQEMETLKDECDRLRKELAFEKRSRLDKRVFLASQDIKACDIAEWLLEGYSFHGDSLSKWFQSREEPKAGYLEIISLIRPGSKRNADLKNFVQQSFDAFMLGTGEYPYLPVWELDA
jgi:hypothetical protein